MQMKINCLVLIHDREKDYTTVAHFIFEAHRPLGTTTYHTDFTPGTFLQEKRTSWALPKTHRIQRYAKLR